MISAPLFPSVFLVSLLFPSVLPVHVYQCQIIWMSGSSSVFSKQATKFCLWLEYLCQKKARLGWGFPIHLDLHGHCIPDHSWNPTTHNLTTTIGVPPTQQGWHDRRLVPLWGLHRDSGLWMWTLSILLANIHAMRIFALELIWQILSVDLLHFLLAKKGYIFKMRQLLSPFVENTR